MEKQFAVDSIWLVSYYADRQHDKVLWSGAIAQLGERLHGMQEVSGSIPLSSTIFETFAPAKVFCFYVSLNFLLSFPANSVLLAFLDIEIMASVVRFTTVRDRFVVGIYNR